MIMYFNLIIYSNIHPNSVFYSAADTTKNVGVHFLLVCYLRLTTTYVG